MKHRAHRRRPVVLGVVAVMAVVATSCLFAPGGTAAGAATGARLGSLSVNARAASTTTTVRPTATTTALPATTTTTTTTVPRPVGPSSVSRVRASGGALTLDGRPWSPVGVNAYSLATWWGRNPGCGSMYTDAQLEAFFAGLPPNALVRTWAWQGTMTTAYRTGQRDWGPLDRVVAAAQRHGTLLVLSATSQSGGCDDNHWKDAAWYSGGYRTQYPGDGYTRTASSFDTYLTELVTRYRSSPAVAMWEPVNEPEGAACAPGSVGEKCYGHLTCPDERGAATAIRSFYDSVGARIHQLDPGRPVHLGAIGSGQCGLAGADYGYVAASPGVDVTSFHDYTGSALSPSALTTAVAASRLLGKPLLVGEMGRNGGSGNGCPTAGSRALTLGSAVQQRLASGASGVLLWNADVARPSPCDMTLLPGDPAFGLLR